MARNEWVGVYELWFEEYHSYKNEWVKRHISLGKCLCNDEAMQKAVNYINAHNMKIKFETMYITDGWGNRFYAMEG